MIHQSKRIKSGEVLFVIYGDRIYGERFLIHLLFSMTKNRKKATLISNRRLRTFLVLTAIFLILFTTAASTQPLGPKIECTLIGDSELTQPLCTESA